MGHSPRTRGRSHSGQAETGDREKLHTLDAVVCILRHQNKLEAKVAEEDEVYDAVGCKQSVSALQRSAIPIA